MDSNYKPFVKVVYVFAALIFSLGFLEPVYSNELKPGTEVPDKMISMIYPYETTDVSLHDFKKDRVMLIAFVPSVSPVNDYADVLTSAFDAYFAEGLSFRDEFNKAYEGLSIAVVSYDSPDELAAYSMQMDLNYAVICDKNLTLTKAFGVEGFSGDNASAKVFIVNKDNSIAYSEEYYRAEGEKLKTLERKLFELLEIAPMPVTENRYSPLFTGDEARDFTFSYVSMDKEGALSNEESTEGTLSALKGKNVLLGFYPAAFSFSCGGEISTFTEIFAEDELPVNAGESFEDLEVLMVSSGNTALLTRWMNSMNFDKIKFVSDDNADISAKYNSYFFDLGYNKRTIFLIDKQGKVAYIDWDYQVNKEDLALLQSEIKKLN